MSGETVGDNGSNVNNLHIIDIGQNGIKIWPDDYALNALWFVSVFPCVTRVNFTFM